MIGNLEKILAQETQTIQELNECEEDLVFAIHRGKDLAKAKEDYLENKLYSSEPQTLEETSLI